MPAHAIILFFQTVLRSRWRAEEIS